MKLSRSWCDRFWGGAISNHKTWNRTCSELDSSLPSWMTQQTRCHADSFHLLLAARAFAAEVKRRPPVRHSRRKVKQIDWKVFKTACGMWAGSGANGSCCTPCFFVPKGRNMMRLYRAESQNSSSSETCSKSIVEAVFSDSKHSLSLHSKSTGGCLTCKRLEGLGFKF